MGRRSSAREMVPNFGMGGRAEFLAGDLVDTGLPSTFVDAVLCVDSVQFADPPDRLPEPTRLVNMPASC